MSKIKDWLISNGLSSKDIEDMCCPHGSFTCGLLTKLKMKTRCRFCKEASLTESAKEEK